ncbi:MAG TPA: glycosyltransferase family 4 protein [Steroidobacteraceae bacterium]
MANAPLSAARASRRACHSVLMVGTHLRTAGGIRTVVQGYLEGGLFRTFPGVYVQTHRNGGVWGKLFYALRGYIAIAWYLLRLDAPLVHVHMASRASFWRKSIVILMARARGRPYIVHLHGGEFSQFYQDECGPREQRFVRSILEKAALVLALSDEWRQKLLRICPRATIEVLPNAVPLPEPRALHSATPLAPTVLFLGDIRRAKGTYDLVHAFAHIAERFPKARLLCGGIGAIEQVRALAQQLGIADRVDCPGWLDRAQKQRALACASIFVLPSYAEGLPMSLLEAMSWGLPVITTPVGGIPQVVQHEANGCLVQPGNIDDLAAAMTTLLESPAARARLGAAARSTIESHYTLDRALQRLGEIYGRFGLTALTGWKQK